jgi:polysaccharide deacetylase family protein (PEP-CTERM system associated)
MKNILSFDVEEHFQVSGLESAVKRSDWDKLPSRVESSTRKVLDLLARRQVKATFFILGWIAERFPDLVKSIYEKGHEIACHGQDHRLINTMTTEEFTADVKQAKDRLEAIISSQVYGYRAPSFSLAAADMDRFEALADMGFTYDSSLFPIKHFRYGEARSVPLGPFDIKQGERLVIKEFPMSVVDLFGRTIPAGGGGYFRLYPMFLLRRNFNRIIRSGRPVIIYLHPWEFDPDQPRIHGAERGNTFRHYHNLHKTESKLDNILQRYDFCSFRDYLEQK